MSLLLSLGCAGLRSGWCLHGRAEDALVGRLLSRPTFGVGATTREVDFWMDDSCPAAVFGSGRAFSATPLPGPAASSIGRVPGYSPTAPAAGYTSAGQWVAIGGAFGSWVGVAAWGSSGGWVRVALGAAVCWAAASGGPLLG